MKYAALLALAFSLACSHATSTGSGDGAPVVGRGIKHAVRPMDLAADLEQNPVPSVFEQALCNAMFELNAKQVVCADDVRAVLRIQQERATLGGDAMSMEEIEKALDAPRQVRLSAVNAGGQLRVTVVVSERGGKTLGRFESLLAGDGGNLTSEANTLAKRVLSLP